MDPSMWPNWHVITGAPSSGKTTTLKLLEEKGHRVVYEMARMYIDEELKKGKTLTQIRGDEAAFQREVLRRKVALEKTLDPHTLYFLERGIPDSIAYYQACGVLYDAHLQKVVTACSYKKVFLLELISFEKDYARTEDANQAKRLDKLLAKCYKDVGMPVIPVPPVSVEERLAFILKNITP